MWHTRYEQYTKGWFEIKLNVRVKLHQIVDWCGDYNSPKGFFVNYNDKSFSSDLRIKFESQEDMMMFMMFWLDL